MKRLESIQTLAKKMEQQLASGQEPDEATATAYEGSVRDLETSPVGFVYCQTPYGLQLRLSGRTALA